MQCILKHNTGYDRSDLPEILSGWFMKPNSLSKTPLVCLAVFFYHKLFLVIKSFKIQEPLERSLFSLFTDRLDNLQLWIEQTKIKTCILKYASKSFYNEGIFKFPCLPRLMFLPLKALSIWTSFKPSISNVTIRC